MKREGVPLGKFWRLSSRDKGLLLEVLLGFAGAYVSITLLPFRRVATGIGVHSMVSPERARASDREVTEAIRRAIGRAARYLPKRRQCMVRSLAGQKMLKRREISYTFYLGLSRSSPVDDEGLFAHAWLRSGELIVTGDDPGLKLDELTVVSTFAYSRDGDLQR